MRNSCVYISSAHRALVAVFFLAIAAPFACATPLTAGQLTDLMVENQGDNAEFIAIVFGTDANSPLAFTSNVNSAGTLFTFSLTPTLYRGQSMTLTGTGSYDSTTNILQLSSSGSLGSTSWTTAGTAAVTFSGSDLNVLTNINFLNGGVEKSADVHAEGFVRADGTTGGFGFDTDKNGDPIPGTTRVFKDDRQSEIGTWHYNPRTAPLLPVRCRSARARGAFSSRDHRAQVGRRAVARIVDQVGVISRPRGYRRAPCPWRPPVPETRRPAPCLRAPPWRAPRAATAGGQFAQQQVLEDAAGALHRDRETSRCAP